MRNPLKFGAASAALLIGSVAGATAQDADMRQFEGTELDMLYAEISFIPGLRELLPDFEEMTGITVNIETLSEGAARQKAQIESATGSGAFDIVGIQSGNLPLYAENGWVVPVEDYFESEFADPEQLALDDFIPSTLQAMSYDDTQYCLPFFAATVILYYQIDKFEEAGITEPPSTFDELLEVAGKVGTPDVPALALRGSPPSTAGNIWIFNVFMLGEGGKYFADFPDDMTPTVDTPEVQKALELFTTLKQDYTPDGSVNFVFDDVVTAMQQGNVVMAIEGAPLAGRILDPEQSRVAGNLGFAVVPGGPAGPKPAFAAHGLCISASSDNPEAAYMFLEWALSQKTMIEVSQNSTYLATPRTSIWENETFNEKYNFDYGGGSFLDAYQSSLEVAPPDYYPPTPIWQLVSDRMGQAVQSVEIGQSSAAEALADAQEGITEILEDEGYLP
ncbi:multiple sugar transport system substrate-binding protein/sorbitol/mannitol transport system substrate-binding protein [Palleronia aestuarii]|uniref:Multiple sugar transport system substrate-binding protein/sorbitol/mannitol transport system substrate-binding protein n=1 Tax=Palleronia aestuarii TaxID=568105 RepID=A0A2W7MYX7_9RHOB|nr:sugar ABC transporter substrate-binding protein [Palleronia aestuarii]PZX12871.1 multiple sugar transport system substrate-binding protein/sorbitol/mannitol transport system substrate-binding protein [Palleronia aestuarii]